MEFSVLQFVPTDLYLFKNKVFHWHGFETADKHVKDRTPKYNSGFISLLTHNFE